VGEGKMRIVKICGLTNFEDASFAVECGADFIGFVFAESPRRVTPEKAFEILKALPEWVVSVGVFANEPLERVEEMSRFLRLSYVQLHGSESREYAEALSVPFIKAFKAKDESVLDEIKSFGVEMFILDSYASDRLGGTGKRLDFCLAQKAARLGKMILAGGLTPDNVAEAGRRVNPFGVDVSSGVEFSVGRKDYQKLKRFVEEVRRCEKK
ncbi:MAG: phosphoribosylanthranilate isomerase, partial [Planctomycetota bacterium]|nr:phosphoribosylanthranilate isomerase [Planctomycetota bacterium]